MDPITLGLMFGGSAISAIVGHSDAKKARKVQEQAIALQREQLAFAKQRYADNEALYGQTKRDLVDMANEGVKADLQGVTDRASADVAQSFQKQAEATNRNLSRYGINPNSGRAMAAHNNDALNQAVAEAGLVNSARRNEQRYADETTWNRRNDVAKMGVQEGQFDFSGVNNATQGLSGAINNQANLYQQSANSAYNVAGSLAGMGLAGMLNKPTTTTGSGNINLSGMTSSTPNYTNYASASSPYNLSMQDNFLSRGLYP